VRLIKSRKFRINEIKAELKLLHQMEEALEKKTAKLYAEEGSQRTELATTNSEMEDHSSEEDLPRKLKL
jgi:hypothetical protein